MTRKCKDCERLKQALRVIHGWASRVNDDYQNYGKKAKAIQNIVKETDQVLREVDHE